MQESNAIDNLCIVIIWIASAIPCLTIFHAVMCLESKKTLILHSDGTLIPVCIPTPVKQYKKKY